MNIIDKTGEYIVHILRDNNPGAYENSYPALFKHYYKFWAKRGRSFVTLSEKEVAERSSLILSELPDIEAKFTAFGLDIADLDFVLFVGQDTSNGHAFKDNEKMVVWIPIESYISSSLVRVFITHEIIHALHYVKSPDYYSENSEDMRRMSRELITEGLATYLTAKILNVDDLTALWADYLPADKTKSWLDECERRKTELYGYILDNYDRSGPDIKLFQAADPDDILKFRAGYYAGMKIVERIERDMGIEPVELLDIARDEFEKAVYRLLENML